MEAIRRQQRRHRNFNFTNRSYNYGFGALVFLKSGEPVEDR